MKKAILSFAAILAALLCCAQPQQAKYKHILLRDFRTVRSDEVYNFNIGTSAHGPGTLHVLQNYLPQDVEITVWATKPLEPSLQAMMDKRFPGVRIVCGSLHNPSKAPTELKKAVDEADLFLISSGSGISPSIVPSIRDFMNYTATPIAAYAIGYNKNQKEFLSKMDFAWFRDEISAREAAKAPFTPVLNGWAPDAVFYFDCVDTEAAKRFMKEHRLKKGRFICCIPGFRHTPSSNLSPEKLAANEEHIEKDNAILRQTIIEAVRKFGVKVLICAEQIPEVELCKKVIYDKLPEDVRSKCVYVTQLWAPDLALGVYKNSLCVYGIEMHSQVMALGNGVPACIFRHATFRNKSDMWNSVGAGEWLLDIDERDATAKACRMINSILANPKAAYAKVARAREIIDSASRAAVKASFFGQPGPRFSKKEIMAHWENLCGNGSPYPDSAIVHTKAPKGYKPFYITHFGRHGSRYLNKKDQYEGLYDILKKAESAGCLSDTGRVILGKISRVVIKSRGKGGQLLPRGKREHAGIMERMVREYPEVFHEKARVSAYATIVPRVQESMEAALSKLEEMVPSAKIETRSEDFGKTLFQPQLGSKFGRSLKYKKDFGAVSQPERVMKMLFSDASFISPAEKDNLLYWFWTVSIGALLDDDLDIDLFQYLKKEEIYPLWKRRDAFFYNAFGPGEKPGALDSVPLLNRMIGLVDGAIAGKGNDADLHYGHDTQLMPFERLVGIADCDTPVPSDMDICENLDRYYWDFATCPMGGNVQFVFYKGKRNDAVLVKCLMNEHEMHFSGLEPFQWPYYKWTDVREYWIARLGRCSKKK